MRVIFYQSTNFTEANRDSFYRTQVKKKLIPNWCHDCAKKWKRKHDFFHSFFMYGNTYLKLLFLVSLFRKHGLKKMFLVSLFPKQEPKKCVSCFLVSETHDKTFVSCFLVSETTDEKWCFLFPVSKQKQRNLIQLFRNKCFLPISGRKPRESRLLFRYSGYVLYFWFINMFA